MGDINHKAVLATTWSDEVANKIDAWIGNADYVDPKYAHLFVEVVGVVNSYVTFVLAPCGSTEGWGTDLEHGLLREAFIEFLDSLAYDDGSSSVEYVEVLYGDYGQEIVKGNTYDVYEDE